VPTPAVDDNVPERRRVEPALRRLGSFAFVGALGFAIDAAILSALVHGFDWPHYTARALSFGAAVTVTWYCNRSFVFRATANRSREYGAYFTAQLVGAAINLGTYVLVIVAVPRLAALPVVPLAIGAAVALLFNFLAASRWVFAADRSPP
jgi:putative flippase GtrA